MGSVRAVHEYMTDSPTGGHGRPDRLPLRGTHLPERRARRTTSWDHPPPPLPTFAGTLRPCRSVVRLPESRENSPRVQRHIRRGLRNMFEAVLRHAADQGYPGPLG